MPKKRRHGQRSAGRGQQVSGHPARRASRQRQQFGGSPYGPVKLALDSPSPAPLLMLVSSLIAIAERRGAVSSDDAEDGLDVLVDIQVATIRRESTALLAGLAHLVPDESLRELARLTVESRPHVLPRWLEDLDNTVVDRAVEISVALRDSEQLLLQLRMADAEPITLGLLVNHTIGSVVDDAVLREDAIDELLRDVSVHADPDTTIRELDLADARARIDEAIAHGDRLFPPTETESWPATRALALWVAQRLPGGGTGYLRPETSDADRSALAAAFLASPFAAHLDTDDHRSLVDDMLWYETDYGTGDPLRVSPDEVAIMLTDWVPRKIVADVPYLSRLPEVLRAYIPYAHQRAGIPAHHTRVALLVADRCEPSYQQVIRTPRLQGAAALAAAAAGMSVVDGSRPDGFGGDDADDDVPDNGLLALAVLVMRHLRHVVGGDRALRRLSTVPLPDEPFDASSVPAHLQERVAAVVDLVDAFCTSNLSVEHRTAARRFLARLVAADPAAFGTRATPASTAAAVCWLVWRSNVFRGSNPLTAKRLAAELGVKRVPYDRAWRLLLEALPDRPDPSELMRYDPAFGSVELLVSAYRAELIRLRDFWDAVLTGRSTDEDLAEEYAVEELDEPDVEALAAAHAASRSAERTASDDVVESAG